MEQILDRLVTLLIAISNLTKLSAPIKRVKDRSEKNDGRNGSGANFKKVGARTRAP